MTDKNGREIGNNEEKRTGRREGQWGEWKNAEGDAVMYMRRGMRKERGECGEGWKKKRTYREDNKGRGEKYTTHTHTHPTCNYWCHEPCRWAVCLQ